MTLAEWLSTSSLTPEQFAERLGTVSGSGIRKWMSGERQPDADMIERLHLVSDGEVTPQEMHRTRLAWLKLNRPEKFNSAPATSSLPPADRAAGSVSLAEPAVAEGC